MTGSPASPAIRRLWSRLCDNLCVSLTDAFRREDGTVTVEMVLSLPILIWGYAATFVFFDAYHEQTANVRATYTLGDALSRETNFITPNYMNSLEDLQGFLLQTSEDTNLRVTVIRYQESRDRHRVVWSEVRGSGAIADLRDADIAEYYDQIPIMADAGRVIMVESWSNYLPDYTVGLDPFTFYAAAITRPRFAGQLCWNSSNTGSVGTSTC